MRSNFLALAAGLLLICGAGVALPNTAHAATPVTQETELDGNFTVPNGGTAYDIESSNSYCTNGGTSCVPSGYLAGDCQVGVVVCPGLTYADVEAFGPPSGASAATPDELILYCAVGTNTGYNYGFVDVVSSTGNTDYGGTTMSPFAGVYGFAHMGTISGKGTVYTDPTYGAGSEDNPAQVSSVNASGFDPGSGAGYTMGTVTGTQNTNNGADTLNGGQFRITLRGTLYHGTTDTTTQTVSSTPYQGTISCTAGGPHANDLTAAGLDTTSLAEGEIEPSLGDNPFYSGTYQPTSQGFAATAPSSGADFWYPADNKCYQGTSSMTGVGTPLWHSNTGTSPGAVLCFQSDGNLVIYQAGHVGDPTYALWSAGTSGHPNDVLVLQSDGNLVIYSDNTYTTALWNAGTSGHPNDCVVFQTNGDLAIYASCT